jgi:hypothetical protein
LKDTGTAPMNLRELAESLGLSQTTVSRALNGYPEVAEGTRARVLEAAARRHNYMPNARAKGLATGRTMAIGHIIPTSHSHEIVNPVFSDFILGAGEVYREQGFDMVLSLVADDEQARVYHELAARGTVDGIILHAPRVGDPSIAFLRDRAALRGAWPRLDRRDRLFLGRRQQPPRLPARDRIPDRSRASPDRADQRARTHGFRPRRRAGLRGRAGGAARLPLMPR